MKLLQELLEALSGQERKAMDLGRSTGRAGKPIAKRETIEKNLGPQAWGPYSEGYKEGKREFDGKDAEGDDRRSRIAQKTAAMKEDQDLNEAGGADRAAIKLAKSAGSKGHPALSKAQIEKSFGKDSVKPYMDAYKEARDIFDNKDAGEAWREKNAARREGRKYHE